MILSFSSWLSSISWIILKKSGLPCTYIAILQRNVLNSTNYSWKYSSLWFISSIIIILDVAYMILICLFEINSGVIFASLIICTALSAVSHPFFSSCFLLASTLNLLKRRTKFTLFLWSTSHTFKSLWHFWIKY